MPHKEYRIAIVEDNPRMLEFLLETFNETTDLICQSSYKNAEEAIAFLPKSDVDIVIVDIKLPKKNGIDCIREVKALRPDMLFIVYTVFELDTIIFESLKVGANGYLLKSSYNESIVMAVRELAAGGSPMSPLIARKVTDFFFNRSNKNDFKELELLSRRETSILELLSKGLFYKEIADVANITEGTVKQHIHKIYKKLHVSNKTEAINKYLGRTNNF